MKVEDPLMDPTTYLECIEGDVKHGPEEALRTVAGWYGAEPEEVEALVPVLVQIYAENVLRTRTRNLERIIAALPKLRATVGEALQAVPFLQDYVSGVTTLIENAVEEERAQVAERKLSRHLQVGEQASLLARVLDLLDGHESQDEFDSNPGHRVLKEMIEQAGGRLCFTNEVEGWEYPPYLLVSNFGFGSRLVGVQLDAGDVLAITVTPE